MITDDVSVRRDDEWPPSDIGILDRFVANVVAEPSRRVVALVNLAVAALTELRDRNCLDASLSPCADFAENRSSKSDEQLGADALISRSSTMKRSPSRS